MITGTALLNTYNAMREQGKKPSEIIVESLASYCGEVFRRDRALSNQEVASLMIRVKAIEAETKKIKGALLNAKAVSSFPER